MMMKAAYQSQYGKSDVLQIGALLAPTVKSHQVLVANHASSINPRDWMIRAGKYQLQFLAPKFPLILGSDLAGVVTQVGSNVSHFKVGDRVYGMKNPSQGLATYAEQVVVNEASLAKIPEQLSFTQAAGVPLCALTAWQALVEKAGLKENSATQKKVLIIGASGGVGSFAVQIAKAFNAQVSAVCSSKNSKLVSKLGADMVIDYESQDILDGQTQYDIIFDTIGLQQYTKCQKLLTKTGVFVSTVPSPASIQHTIKSKLPLLLGIKKKRCALVMVNANGEQLSEISKLITQHIIWPLTDRIYPLEDVAQAQDYSRSQRARGKIILQIRD